ncbi:complement C1q-like protein 4 [Mytilus trossulus]|uniref:complement C1q-like protein 4 n=1 Tax=Mytilus trossulus TaxID=6551 RepID=UPI0030042987
MATSVFMLIFGFTLWIAGDSSHEVSSNDCRSDIVVMKRQLYSLQRQNLEILRQNEEILTKYENIIKLLGNEDGEQKSYGKRLLVPASTIVPATAVAFSAALTHNIQLGQDQIVEFDKVITNIRNAFDSRHSHFTAPVKGIYLFSCSLFADGGNYVHVDIVKNGNAIGYLYANSNHHISTETVVIELETGDMVWMKHRGDPIGKALIYGSPAEQFNTFSGVLIHQLV